MNNHISFWKDSSIGLKLQFLGSGNSNRAPRLNNKIGLFLFFFFILCFVHSSISQELEVIEKKTRALDSGINTIKPSKDYSEEELAYITGYLYESRGDVDKAMLFYKKSLGFQENYIPAKTNLAIILFEKERYKESIQHFFELYKAHPQSALSINNYGLAMLFKGNKLSAIKIFREGVIKFPRDYEILFNLATAYYKNKSFNSAKGTYKRVLLFKKNDYATLNNLGCTFLSLKEFSNAVQVLKKAVKARPDYSQGYYNLAFAHWKMGHIDKAKLKVEEVLRRNPNHRLARLLKKNLP